MSLAERIHSWEKSNFKVLDISGLRLRCWPDELDGKEHLIIEFDCSGNKFSKIPLLSECVSLNCHSSAVEVFEGLPKCKELVCYFNRIAELPNDLQVCEKLCIDYNKITKLPENLDMCKHICCKGNVIENIKFYKNRKGLVLNYE